MAVFDMRTIAFSNLLIALACTMVLLLLWRQSRARFRGMGFWVFDYFFQTTALFFIVARGVIPDWMSIIISNTLIVAGAMLGYAGLKRFVGQPDRNLPNAAVLALFAAVHTYFTFAQPSLSARTLNISFGLLIVCFQCLWLLLRGVKPGMRPLTRYVGIVFAGYCLVSLIRIAMHLTKPGITSDYFQSGGFESITLVSYQLLFILLAYTLVLMVNQRLHLEIRSQEIRFSTAFHSSPYAIVITRLSDGLIEEVNASFLKITGYRLEEIIGNTTIDMKLWKNLKDRNVVREKLLQNGKVGETEFEFRTKSGNVITCLFSAEIILFDEQEYVLSSINNITARKRVEQEKEQLIMDLKSALAEVKTLRGFIPICASCKKIRDDSGYWQQIEQYIQDRSDALFSHGICPDCAKKLYPELYKDE